MQKKDTTKRPRGKRGMGRLYKRDAEGHEHRPEERVKGTFWLEYRLNGKRVRTALKDRDGKPITRLRAAEQERLRIVGPYLAADRLDAAKRVQSMVTDAERELAEAEDRAHPPLPIAAAWEAYTEDPGRPDSGPRTLADYRGYFAAFTAWLHATHPEADTLRDVTPDIARQYAAHLTRKKASPNTFNKHIAFLKLFFRVLRDRAKTPGNPFDAVQRKKLATNSRRELSLEELYRVLSTAEGDLALLLGLGTFTGLRLGDCCTLKWGEVDLHRGIIKRIPNKIKGRRADPEPVVIGIPPDLHRALSQTPPNERTGYVLPDLAAEYLDRGRQGNITRRIQKHFTACGIQIHREGTGFKTVTDKDGNKHAEHTGTRAVVEVGFHSLRHTWVSLHAAAGTPQALIQKSAGHRNPAMTRHYTHVSEAAARRAVAALPSFTGDAAPEQGDRDPLPPWAREIVEGMTAKTWRKAKAELLKGGRA